MTPRKIVGWLVFLGLVVSQGSRIAAGACFLVGSQFYSAGNYQAASVIFQTSVHVYPGFARGYVELGSSHLKLKNYQKAEEAFLKARSIQDESCASCGLGATYAALHRYDDAETAFRRAQTLNPKDACTYDHSGRMYYDLGKYQEAIAAFKQAVSLSPSYGTYMYLGNSYVYAREFEPSVDAYKKAIRLRPKDAQAHLQLGIAYDYLTRYDEAVAEYKQAIELDADDEEAHQSLISTYLAMHNKPAALAQCEVLRKINADMADQILKDLALLQDRERGKEKLYFIPLGNFRQEALTKLVSYYKQKLGIEATAVAPLPLALSTIDPRRQQVIAEEAVELMKNKYPKLAADSNAILIGLTDDDMYIRERKWQYAFNYWIHRRFAVVSSARLNPANLGESADDDLLEQRMRKVVLKNIGMLYYLMPANYNPKSVLYDEVDGVEDLDKMSEDF